MMRIAGLVLSLKDCPACLVVDDELNILPLSKHAKVRSELQAAWRPEAVRPSEVDEEVEAGERPKTANERRGRAGFERILNGFSHLYSPP